MEVEGTERRWLKSKSSDPQTAAGEFRRKYPQALVETVGDLEVTGFCEACDVPILTGDSYFPWTDVVTCLECGGDGPDHRMLVAG